MPTQLTLLSSICAVALLTVTCVRADVKFESLLGEMIDYAAIARWPKPEFTCKQASSYDRGTVAPDRPGWFHPPDEDSKVKSPATLSEIYCKSAGRNSVLLLNIPPDRRGRIASESLPVRGGKIMVPLKAFAQLSMRLGVEP